MIYYFLNFIFCCWHIALLTATEEIYGSPFRIRLLLSFRNCSNYIIWFTIFKMLCKRLVKFPGRKIWLLLLQNYSLLFLLEFFPCRWQFHNCDVILKLFVFVFWPKFGINFTTCIRIFWDRTFDRNISGFWLALFVPLYTSRGALPIPDSP